MTNPSNEPFYGIAVLHADYRTRHIAPVIVSDPEGKTVPSRIVNETLGEPEADGKRRWAFDLEFFCDCGSTATVAYSARFGDDPESKSDESLWSCRIHKGVLSATEEVIS
ncbi:hypothetical protein [Armatimonas sp.]|uniref:hypothetical protein n=1 Tax=Armatimonas sp. TaxID=1872638 RepID=UPI00286A131F|nr:hypothetical protein [Armatimonas sp.]